MVDHILSEHMDIGNGGSSDRAGGFAVVSAEAFADGSAAEAAGEVADVILFLTHRVEQCHVAGGTAVKAAVAGFSVGCAAAAAEVQRSGAFMFFEFVI
jgi:hypothetical protein